MPGPSEREINWPWIVIGIIAFLVFLNWHLDRELKECVINSTTDYLEGQRGNSEIRDAVASAFYDCSESSDYGENDLY